jgi:glycine/D-amino acid oxidase-like deaminating enzyme
LFVGDVVVAEVFRELAALLRHRRRLTLQAQVAHPALEDSSMIDLTFRYHPDSAADAVRAAQLRPCREPTSPVASPHAETIEHRLYRQALAAEGLAHGVKFTLAGAVSISAFHRAHFALEGLFSDDAGG